MTGEECCNFCGKAASEVGKLIRGGGKQPRAELPLVRICDECVRLAYAILDDETPPPPLSPPPAWRPFREGEEEFEWTVIPQNQGILLLVRRLGKDPPLGWMHPHGTRVQTSDAREVVKRMRDSFPAP